MDAKELRDVFDVAVELPSKHMLYYFHLMLLRRRRVVVYSALECLYSHSQVEVQAAKSGPAIVHRIEGSCAVEEFLFVYMLFVGGPIFCRNVEPA